MIHLGIDTICWHARLASGVLSLESVADEAADLGAEYLQMGVGALSYAMEPSPAAFAERCAARGLRIRATGGPLARRFHDGDAGAAVGRLREELTAAARLGSRTLMVYSGVYRPQFAGCAGEITAEIVHLRRVLREIAPYAADRGMTVEIENASDFTTPEIERLFASGPLEGVALFLDLTNPYNVFDDPIAAVTRLGHLAAAGHVKDFVLDSLYSFDGYHRRGFSLLFRYPGEGMADVPASIAALRKVVGDRDFDLSIEGLDSDPDRDDQRSRLAAGLEFLRRHTN